MWHWGEEEFEYTRTVYGGAVRTFVDADEVDAILDGVIMIKGRMAKNDNLIKPKVTNG